MGKTTAERQTAYRLRSNERNNGDGDRRFSTWLTSQADIALKRLAKHEHATKRAVMERLILAEQELVVKSMSDDQYNDFLSVMR